MTNTKNPTPPTGGQDRPETSIEPALKPGGPVMFVSPEQLESLKNFVDQGEFGRYLPVRNTPAGKFTQPVYTAAPPDVLAIYDEAIDKLQAQVDAFTAALPAIKEVIRISDRKHDAWDAAKAGIAAFAAPPAQTPPPPQLNPQAVGQAVADWCGGVETAHRTDNGEPYKRLTVSVERLGYAVAAVVGNGASHGITGSAA